MKITFVKKRMPDGTSCRKCVEVEGKLRDKNQLQYIDETLFAEEDDPDSPGMLLAVMYGVDQAPFFVVDAEDGSEPEIYTVYFRFVIDVLRGRLGAQ